MKKLLNKLKLRLSILSDFIKTLWKYKLWWSFPIIALLIVVMVLLLIAGHTGIIVFSYPLF